MADLTTQAAANTTTLIEKSGIVVKQGSELVDLTIENMSQLVELSEIVNCYVEGIANNIEIETSRMSAVSKRMFEVSQFAERTRETSETCVSLSERLYEQVNLMNNKIGEFRV